MEIIRTSNLNKTSNLFKRKEDNRKINNRKSLTFIEQRARGLHHHQKVNSGKLR